MRIHHLFWAVVSVLLLAVLPAFPGPNRKSSVSTKGFIIDGRRFLAEDSLGDDISLIRRELSRQGWNVDPDDPDPIPQPLFEKAFHAKADNVAMPFLSLPRDFQHEHTMRLESGGGPVDLFFGRISSSGQKARNSLSACGWETIANKNMPPGKSVATRKNGKETCFVLLEETEGRFLLIRRME